MSPGLGKALSRRSRKMDTTLPDASGPSRADADTGAADLALATSKPRAKVIIKVEGSLIPARGYLRDYASPVKLTSLI